MRINVRRIWRKTYNWTTAVLAFKIHSGDRLR